MKNGIIHHRVFIDECGYSIWAAMGEPELVKEHTDKSLVSVDEMKQYLWLCLQLLAWSITLVKLLE